MSLKQLNEIQVRMLRTLLNADVSIPEYVENHGKELRQTAEIYFYNFQNLIFTVEKLNKINS